MLVNMKMSNLVKYIIVLISFFLTNAVAVVLFIFPVEHYDLTAWLFCIVLFIATLTTLIFISNEREDSL